MAKEMTNEMHTCINTKVPLNLYESSFEKIGYSNDELVRIISFYVLHAPILKTEKEIGDGKGLKCLSDFKWRSVAELNELERTLLKVSGIHNFVMKKTDRIDEILSDMNLEGDLCIEHPRAVLKQSHTLSVTQYNVMKNEPKEKRLVCLFRHIRNSIAHDCVYKFDNDNILLEDMDENKTISARILIRRQTLLEWIDVVNSKM